MSSTNKGMEVSQIISTQDLEPTTEMFTEGIEQENVLKVLQQLGEKSQ